MKTLSMTTPLSNLTFSPVFRSWLLLFYANTYCMCVSVLNVARLTLFNQNQRARPSWLSPKSTGWRNSLLLITLFYHCQILLHRPNCLDTQASEPRHKRPDVYNSRKTARLFCVFIVNHLAHSCTTTDDDSLLVTLHAPQAATGWSVFLTSSPPLLLHSFCQEQQPRKEEAFQRWSQRGREDEGKRDIRFMSGESEDR